MEAANYFLAEPLDSRLANSLRRAAVIMSVSEPIFFSLMCFE